MTAPKRKDPLIEHCRSLPGATEDVKWGKDLIFSVGGKMFAGFQLPEGEPLAFKVEPAVFDSLTAREGVIPAPYMAKHSWISVTSRKRLPATKLKGLLTDAHRLTAEKLSAKMRKSLGLAALACALLLTPDVRADSADVRPFPGKGD